jgi:hypothetical protein
VHAERLEEGYGLPAQRYTHEPFLFFDRHGAPGNEANIFAAWSHASSTTIHFIVFIGINSGFLFFHFICVVIECFYYLWRFLQSLYGAG